MLIFKKPIFTGFAPNLSKEELLVSLKYLFLPWFWFKWYKGTEVQKAEEKLAQYLQVGKVLTFDSGRSALYFILQALGSNEDQEVLVQSYTCMVVINAIRFTGAKPVFVDVKSDFNMDPEDLLKKITPKTKILIIQHTFGKPADLQKLLEIAKENNLKVVEDCAHALGAKYQNKFLGTFGEAAILSFGPDKIISCVRGGAAITSNPELAKKLAEIQRQLPRTPKFKVLQHLIYYPIFSFTKPLYNLFVGKVILVIAKTLKFYGRIINQQEKLGLPEIAYPAQLPNALGAILNVQVDKLSSNLLHRQTLAKYYNDNLNNKLFEKPIWSNESVWLRYTILINNPAKLHNYTKKQGIILGNWYDAPVAPKDIDLKATGYILGTCPNDEKIAQMSINLPTDPTITQKDAEKITKLLNEYV